MKNKYAVALLTFNLTLFSNSVLALGTSPWTFVDEIIQGTGSQPLVKLSNPGDASTGCTAEPYLRFVDADTGPGKRQISTLLAALSSGKEVRIQTKSCSADYAYIDHVYIRR